ncbi:MAG TPA: DUF969 family protein [Blastocatellia bacterium]|nr:DUF969 family protein [Blastocatellia bacterium]
MNDFAWLKLIGIVIVVVGLALRLRTTLVVVAAGLATGLVAGMPPAGIVELLGRAFAENRFVTLFIVTLPAVGLAERYGLREQAAALIRRFAAATAGRLLIVYQLFRVLMGALGLRLNGHPAFVRPLVYPMSIGAAASTLGVSRFEDVPPAADEKIKAAVAGAENYGNFYGQNLSPVQAGVLLVYGVLQGLGLGVSIWRLVLFAVPVTALSVILGALQFRRLDGRLAGGRDE